MEELNPIPDHIAPGLSILFVGFNPSVRSSETGHHYANPSNRFWKILHLTKLTPRLYGPEEDGELLSLGYGFTNIVPRPTRTAQEITREEYDQGRQMLLAKLMNYRPKTVCFVGKGVYEQFARRKTDQWGFQPEALRHVPGVREFVGPSSSGLVRMKLDEMVDIYRELSEWKNADSKGRAT